MESNRIYKEGKRLIAIGKIVQILLPIPFVGSYIETKGTYKVLCSVVFDPEAYLTVLGRIKKVNPKLYAEYMEEFETILKMNWSSDNKEES